MKSHQIVYYADPRTRTLERLALPIDGDGRDVDREYLRAVLDTPGAIASTAMQLKPFRNGASWWAMSADIGNGFDWRVRLPKGMGRLVNGPAVFALYRDTPDGRSQIVSVTGSPFNMAELAKACLLNPV